MSSLNSSSNMSHTFIFIYSSVTAILRTLSSCLDSSVGRELHWYRTGHEFESRSSLNFLGFLFTTAKLRTNCEDLSSI